MSARTANEANAMVSLSRHLADAHGIWLTRMELRRETLDTLTQRHVREHGGDAHAAESGWSR